MYWKRQYGMGLKPREKTGNTIKFSEDLELN